MALHCARRFNGRGEPMDDLVQVALVGVCKAVDRYDPDFGVHFASFAVPTVLGELRRYFRDATWPVHVPRRVKELHLRLAAAIDDLHQQLGRAPRVGELAEHMGATEEDVLVGMEASAAYRSTPLTPPGDGDGEGAADRYLGIEDADLAGVDDTVLLRSVLGRLPERERTIVELRYFEGRTQQEISNEVGLSQVHVSRLLRASLERLQRELTGCVSSASRAGSARA